MVENSDSGPPPDGDSGEFPAPPPSAPSSISSTMEKSRTLLEPDIMNNTGDHKVNSKDTLPSVSVSPSQSEGTEKFIKK